jgi:hypothetical protein
MNKPVAWIINGRLSDERYRASELDVIIPLYTQDQLEEARKLGMKQEQAMWELAASTQEIMDTHPVKEQDESFDRTASHMAGEYVAYKAELTDEEIIACFDESEPVAWVYPEGLEALKAGKPWTAYGTRQEPNNTALYLSPQPDIAPYAWVTFTPYGDEDDVWYENPEGQLLEGWTYKPLYDTTLPQRTWVGLTNDELTKMFRGEEYDRLVHKIPDLLRQQQAEIEMLEAELKAMREQLNANQV